MAQSVKSIRAHVREPWKHQFPRLSLRACDSLASVGIACGGSVCMFYSQGGLCMYFFEGRKLRCPMRRPENAFKSGCMFDT